VTARLLSRHAQSLAIGWNLGAISAYADDTTMEAGYGRTVQDADAVPFSVRRGEALPALTGLRFFAAFHVILLHFASPLLGHDSGFMGRIVEKGFVGVGLFFMLSGFVLAYVYEEVRNVSGFWQARFARVYPTHLFALALYVPFAMATVAHGVAWRTTAASGIACVLLLQSLYPWFAYYWNPPSWSLSAEAVFYAVFPWLRPRIQRIRALVPALLATWVVALLPPFVYLRLDPDGTHGAFDAMHSHWFDFVHMFPLFRLPDFVFGALLGVAFVRYRRAIDPRLGPVLAATGVLATLVVLGATNAIPSIVLLDGLLQPAFGLTLFGLALGGGPIAWLLGRRPLIALGEASYALYILQMPVAMYVQSVSRRLVGRDLLDPRVAVSAVVIMVVASLIAHKRFELPVRRAIREHFARDDVPMVSSRMF
jgi:peptidoglycan/LPS O-acetylase OafA/YrhL